MAEERLQKIMARADIGSRRACEAIIEQGRVKVNGKLVTLGDKADPEKDTITVDEQRIRVDMFTKRYIVFNKPKNVLSTNKKPEGDDRDAVRDLIPIEGHFFTIGRLDAESEGLMVLTNDGDLTHKLSHPSFEHTKTYKVTVYGQPDTETLERWEAGLWLDGTRTAPCYVRVMEQNPQTTTLRVVMIEGRKRQIRRIAAMLGHPVRRLVRTHIGQLGLGTLKKGAYYELEDEEVQAMKIPAEEVKYMRRKNRRPRPPRDNAQSASQNRNSNKGPRTPRKPTNKSQGVRRAKKRPERS
ncbi:rRNA pseudouridine synthase [Phototrophicus methaneseepsis]|uniref:Pseudouridine synthase n=1 Tax=Phototrophicus methaneseepsis TaxID=2710758 RepID=A0A7S8E5E0_9CHLR|nr:pseudouridine synthase [Phototrophicus methaneseepsis]QPC80677.1 rRNA pseudouridine synthase [Phototrophicus methaneseepsis]